MKFRGSGRAAKFILILDEVSDIDQKSGSRANQSNQKLLFSSINTNNVVTMQTTASIMRAQPLMAKVIYIFMMALSANRIPRREYAP